MLWLFGWHDLVMINARGIFRYKYWDESLFLQTTLKIILEDVRLVQIFVRCENAPTCKKWWFAWLQRCSSSSSSSHFMAVTHKVSVHYRHPLVRSGLGRKGLDAKQIKAQKNGLYSLNLLCCCHKFLYSSNAVTSWNTLQLITYVIVYSLSTEVLDRLSPLFLIFPTVD